MDPNYERRLIEEVIYLHSLWHQGPPRQPRPQPQPLITNRQSSAARLLHHPLNPTRFKKQRVKRKPEAQCSTQSPSPASDKEWPCNPSSGDSPATTSAWGPIWPKPNSKPLLLSPEEKAKLGANQAQSKALKVVKDYFKTHEDEESSEDDDDFMEEEDGCEEYRFFVELFKEDSALREYYNKNYQNGEFSCLVCSGVGQKLAGKKFKGCIALVQHSISITRTNKRRSHRAYGQAICQVLGWDIDNLSSIVSSMTEKQEESLNVAASSAVGALEGEGDAQANVGEGIKDDLTASESNSADVRSSSLKDDLTAPDSNSANVSNSSLKDDLIAHESNSVDVSNSGEDEPQAMIDERTKDGSTTLENKEGSTDVMNSGKGEVGFDNVDKAQAIIDEGTKDGSTTHPHPHPHPQPQPLITNRQSSAARLLHHPLNPTRFKKQRVKSKTEAQCSTQSPSPASDKEWPCHPSSGGSPATTSAWGPIWPKPNSEPLLLSPQEKAKLAANQAQCKALKVVKDYFKTDDDGSGEDEDDDDDFMEEEDGSEEYRFFVELFKEDSALREYYNKNYQNGEFSCLVCSGVGKKLAGKKFKGCIALVQHSILIARTNKRRFHMAYGQAICQVIGWDIDNLSSIVSSMTEKHEESLNGTAPSSVGTLEGEGDAQANIGEGIKDDLTSSESNSADVGNSSLKDDLIAPESNSVDVSNSEEGEPQAMIDEGTKDGSTTLENKEGSTDVMNSGKGEVVFDNVDKAQAIIDEGTKDGSTALENNQDSIGECEFGCDNEGKAQEPSKDGCIVGYQGKDGLLVLDDLE